MQFFIRWHSIFSGLHYEQATNSIAHDVPKAECQEFLRKREVFKKVHCLSFWKCILEILHLRVWHQLENVMDLHYTLSVLQIHCQTHQKKEEEMEQNFRFREMLNINNKKEKQKIKGKLLRKSNDRCHGWEETGMGRLGQGRGCLLAGRFATRRGEGPAGKKNGLRKKKKIWVLVWTGEM